MLVIAAAPADSVQTELLKPFLVNARIHLKCISKLRRLCCGVACCLHKIGSSALCVRKRKHMRIVSTSVRHVDRDMTAHEFRGGGEQYRGVPPRTTTVEGKWTPYHIKTRCAFNYEIRKRTWCILVR